MPRQVQIEAVFEALGRVTYPGYAADIATLGIVEQVAPLPDGGFALTLRQATARDDVMQRVAERVHHALAHDLGVAKVELRVRRVEPELGEKTGRVRLDGTQIYRRGREREGRRRQIHRRGESRLRACATRPVRRAARCRYLRAVGADDVRDD